jgi:HAMP domain-containing protein
MEYFLVASLTLVAIGLFVIRNLLNKLEAAEDYITNLSLDVNVITKRLKEIDHAGIFESDDEIGWFFEEVKKLGDQLEQYKLK